MELMLGIIYLLRKCQLMMTMDHYHQTQKRETHASQNSATVRGSGRNGKSPQRFGEYPM